MGTMILASQLDTLALAAEAVSELSTDGGADQWWTDLLASALSGLVQLPIALFVMWVFHKFRLDRWFVPTAFLATILAVFVTDIVNAYFWGVYAFAEDILDWIGVDRFVYYAFFPRLFVCLIGAIGFGWWLKRHRSEGVSGMFK